MTQIKRNNHFIPQGLMRRWSKDKNTIYGYRTLVSHEKVPKWEKYSIEKIAFQRDLYSSVLNDMIDDGFENWIKIEYEDPGLNTIDKIVNNRKLSWKDWHKLILFIALQDVRTPTDYKRMAEKWEKESIPVMNNVLQDFKKKFENKEEILKKIDNNASLPSDIFQVKVKKKECGKSEIRTEITIGRDFWKWRIKHLLTETALILLKHKWFIITLNGDFSWPLTDHPVLKLNYYKNGKYDFLGGYNSAKTEIMMPISPWHLIYTQVGSKSLNTKLSFDKDLQKNVGRLLVERGSRWVFSLDKEDWITKLKPRIVNSKLFKLEQEAIERWHENQLNPIFVNS